jgi:hypothetical protein
VFAGLAVAVTVGTQIASAPKTPLPDFGLPAKASAYQSLVATDGGLLLVAGDPNRLVDPWSVTTFGNGWSVAGVNAVNIYTPIGFAATDKDLCLETHGIACPDAVKRIFAVDETTAKPIADLLGIDRVQILAGGGADLSQRPPAGWEVVSKDDQQVLWRRSQPSQGPGPVSWVAPGTQVSQVVNTDRSVSFTVDAAPPAGGQVVLSRLAWPGYSTTAGSIASPVRGYLLTVEVSAQDVGKRLTVSFDPPAWPMLLACLVLAVAGVLIWTAGALLRRWRGKRSNNLPV